MNIETMEARRVLAAIYGADVTWGLDGFLSQDTSVSYLGANGNGFLVSDYRNTTADELGQVVQRYGNSGTADSSYHSIELTGGVTTQADSAGRVYALANDGLKLAINRYDVDGNLENHYGTNGTAKLTLPLELKDNQTLSSVFVSKLAADENGALYVAGYYTIYDYSDNSFDYSTSRVILKLTPEGAVDTSFGDDGFVTEVADTYGSAISWIGSDSQNRLLVADDDYSTTTISRYTSDGVLDAQYGTDGTIDINVVVNKFLLDSQDRLICASDDNDRQVFRFTASGQPDSTFGQDGAVTIGDGDFSQISALTFQPDGKILVSRYSTVQRFNTNGSVDNSFGDSGTITGSGISYLSAVLSDGTMLGEINLSSNDYTISLAKIAPRPAIQQGTSGKLYVFGSGSADAVSIRESSGKTVVYVNNVRSDKKFSNVTGIYSELGSGSDHFDNQLNLPVTLFTGDGNDIVHSAGFAKADLGTGSNMFTGEGGGSISMTDYSNDVTDMTVTGTAGDWDVSLYSGNPGKTKVDLAGTSAYVSLGYGDSIVFCDVTDGATIVAGAGDDSITTTGGNDSINPGLGNDTVSTGDGNDRVISEDYLYSESTANDLYDLGAGNDLLLDGFGNNTIQAGDGNDSIRTGEGNDLITGGLGKDTIRSGDGNDTVDGGGGKDRLFGYGGDDSLSGGGNNDIIIDYFGHNTLIGNQGDDLIVAADPAGKAEHAVDQIDGGRGSDSIYADTDDDRISIETILDNLS